MSCFPPSIPSPFLLRRSQLELKSARRERDMSLFNWRWPSAFFEPTMMPTDTLPGILLMPRSRENRGARWDLTSECVSEGRW